MNIDMPEVLKQGLKDSGVLFYSVEHLTKEDKEFHNYLVNYNKKLDELLEQKQFGLALDSLSELTKELNKYIDNNRIDHPDEQIQYNRRHLLRRASECVDRLEIDWEVLVGGGKK